jgi:pSer/pThr/pTyr-binding forkhead associated (FHA) protein
LKAAVLQIICRTPDVCSQFRFEVTHPDHVQWNAYDSTRVIPSVAIQTLNSTSTRHDHNKAAMTRQPSSVETEPTPQSRSGQTREYARLVFSQSDGEVITKDVLRNTTLIGSAAGCNVQLLSTEILPAHCVITVDSGRLGVRHLHAHMGPLLNGLSVNVSPLVDGDTLEIGPFTFRVETNLASEASQSGVASESDEALVVQDRLKPPDAKGSSATGNSDEKENGNQGHLNRQEASSSNGRIAERDYARLVFRGGDHEWNEKNILRPTTLIGSVEGCNVQLVSRRIAFAHCIITLDGRRLCVRCLRSRSGIQVNGFPVEVSTLSDGDTLKIGPVDFYLETNLDTNLEHLANRVADESPRSRRSRRQRRNQSKQREVEATLQSERNLLDEERRQLSTAQTDLENERLAVEAQREFLEQQRQQTSQVEADLERALQELQQQQEQLAAEHNALQASREQLQAEMKTLHAEQSQFHADVAAIEAEHALLQQQQQESSQTAGELARERGELEQQGEQFESERNTLQASREQFQADLENLHAEQSQFRVDVAAIEAEHALLQQQQQESSQTVDELARERGELEQQGEQFESERNTLQAGRERLEIELNELQSEQNRLVAGASAIEAHRDRLRRYQQKKVTAEADRETANLLFKRGLITRIQSDWFLNGDFSGAIIDQYQVLELLDTGGMGWLYIAKDMETSQKVALKVLSLQHVNNPDLVARFEIEARAGSMLDHPNVIRTFKKEQTGTLHYLVMEVVKGINLHELATVQGPVPWQQACDFIRQTADGLQHAHAVGMVHRDIKPANLLVKRLGQLKLLDFGLALVDNDEDEFALAMLFGHDCLGTADYIAPEQTLDSYSVDARADVYSLGCTFYFALTGEAPFPVASNLEKLHSHRTQDLPSVREKSPDVPEQVAEIVGKMMAKEPLERFQTADEVSRALAPFAKRLPAYFDYHSVLAVRAANARKRLRRDASAFMPQQDVG